MIINLKTIRGKIVCNSTTQRSLLTFGIFPFSIFSTEFYTFVFILILNFDFFLRRLQLFYHVISSILNKTLNGIMISMKRNSYLTIPLHLIFSLLSILYFQKNNHLYI